MSPSQPTDAEIHILACHFITRLSRCRPHALRVFYLAGKTEGDAPKILTRRRLPGESMAQPDPTDGLLVGVYRYPTGFAAFKADLRATVASGIPGAVVRPASPRKLKPDGFPTDAVNDFCSYLLKAKAIAAYWSPSRGRVAFRAVRISDRQPTALPPDAALVGNFTHPCPRGVFAEALQETINENPCRP